LPPQAVTLEQVPPAPLPALEPPFELSPPCAPVLPPAPIVPPTPELPPVLEEPLEVVPHAPDARPSNIAIAKAPRIFIEAILSRYETPRVVWWMRNAALLGPLGSRSRQCAELPTQWRQPSSSVRNT
jgi:hypothetical protein